MKRLVWCALDNMAGVEASTDLRALRFEYMFVDVGNSADHNIFLSKASPNKIMNCNYKRLTRKWRRDPEMVTTGRVMNKHDWVTGQYI